MTVDFTFKYMHVLSCSMFIGLTSSSWHVFKCFSSISQPVAFTIAKVGLGALIYAFNQGAPISSSLVPVLAWWGSNGNGPPSIVSAANIGSIGYFQGQTDAYAGFRLDVAGSLYYGWIHIQNFGANWGQIIDWAYETSPNTPIFAGQVPEPSTGVLLCVCGAVFWGLDRRMDQRHRRNQCDKDQCRC